MDEIIDLKGKTIKVLTFGTKESDAMKRYAKVIQEEYDAKVEYEITPYNDLGPTLARKVLARNAPDVAQLRSSASEFPIFCAKGILQSIDGKINLNTPMWSGIKAINDAYKFKGKYYVIRTSVQAETFIWYNKNVLRDVGGISVMPDKLYTQGKWTWDKLIEYAKACINTKSTPPTYGMATDYGYLKAHILGSAAVDFVNLKNDGTLELNLNSSRLAQALTLYRDVYNKNNIMAPVSMAPAGEEIKLFNNNQLAFMIQGPTAGDPKMHKAGTIGFVPSPRWEGEQPVYALTTTMFGVPKGSKNITGAIAFINAVRYDTVNADNVKNTNEYLKNTYGVSDAEIGFMDDVKKSAFFFTDIGGDSPSWFWKPFNGLMGGKSWSTMKAQYEPKWKKCVNDYNAQIR